MISTSSLYKKSMPKTPNVYTGKNTQELDKRQNYNKLHKKPELIKKKLPTPKNTHDDIVQSKGSK